ncbi:MAG: peptidoglycan-associated lipoprotein Pal [Hyphomicrobiales bacterium]
MRLIAGLRIALIALALVGVAACSSKNKPDVAGTAAAVPGSERDFITNVGDRVQFLIDQSTLTPDAQNILRRQATWMRQYGQVTVQIEGHADERGTREYNIALSARRAERVKNFLIAQGISASRVATIAFGKERPVSLCDAESCWSKNRRAVTVITGGAVSG